MYKYFNCACYITSISLSTQVWNIYLKVFSIRFAVSEDVGVKVSGPNDVKITKKEVVGNSTHVTYLPVTPGEYNIDITAKGKHIHGSPFVAKCTGMWISLDLMTFSWYL